MHQFPCSTHRYQAHQFTALWSCLAFPILRVVLHIHFNAPNMLHSQKDTGAMNARKKNFLNIDDNKTLDNKFVCHCVVNILHQNSFFLRSKYIKKRWFSWEGWIFIKSAALHNLTLYNNFVAVPWLFVQIFLSC